MFVRQQIVCNLVDLSLNLFKAGGEFSKWGRPSDQFFPERPFASHIEFVHRKTTDRGHNAAQAISCRAHVFVPDIGQHRLTDFLKLGLGA